MLCQVRVPQSLTIAGGVEGHTERLLLQPALPRGPSPVQLTQPLTLALYTLRPLSSVTVGFSIGDFCLPLSVFSFLQEAQCSTPEKFTGH